jgi:predicted glycoside hydrolase/deacetylase ChbG (UPF0249 family)
MSATGPRHIILCADDYGISPGVNRGIRDLAEKRRINATSVMVVGPAIGRDEAAALLQSAEGTGCSIGLHVTLTAPFAPLTMHFRPVDGDMFLPLGRLLRSAMLRQLDAEFVYAEVLAQLALFQERFERLPTHIDGHQHVQLFPQIREGFVRAVKETAPQALIRQCGRNATLARRLANPKALLLDGLSAGFRKRCDREQLRYNPAFSGAYDFTRGGDFAALMRDFLGQLPNRGLAMCHPGFVDELLVSLDPLTDQRERELAFLGSDAFPELLKEIDASLGAQT